MLGQGLPTGADSPLARMFITGVTPVTLDDIITVGHRVNGNNHSLEEIITNLGTSATLRKSFRAKELGSSDNFVSFLFYNGLVAVTESDMGEALL